MSRKRRQPTARRITQRKQLTEASAIDAMLNGSGMIDADDYLYRPITGERGDNLPSFQHERMQAIAKYQFRSNPVGSRYISLYTDFVLGEGASVSFRNSAVEDVVMRHWRDPYNDWERSQADYFEHYLIFGELLIPLFPNAVDGHLRCGLQLVENIKAVHADPENWRIVQEVAMRGNGGQPGTRYQVINHREAREVLKEANDPALYWKRGNPLGSRGLSLLYSIADLLDVMDQFVFSEIERAFLLKAFVWDVTIEGAEQAEVDALMKTEAFAPPKPGSVRGHNGKVTWQAVNPQLDTYDAWNGITKLRNHTGGAVGIPEHFFSEGGDVNRATAEAMSEPVLKRLTRIQREWRAIMLDIMQTQVDYAVLAGKLDEMVPVERDGEATDELIAARDAVEVNMPDLSPDDNSKVVTTVETLGRAMAFAVDEGLISEPTAQKIYLTTAQALGVEIVIAEEQERIRAERDERAQRQQEQFERQMDANPPTQLQAIAGGRRNDGAAAGGD